jgi:hypothetical protein
MDKNKEVLADFGEFFGKVTSAKLEDIVSEVDYLNEHLEVYAAAPVLPTK